MAKALVSGGGGRSHNKAVEIRADTAAQLALLIQGEHVYSPETAPAGYASPSAVALAGGSSGVQAVYKRMAALHKAGALKRIAVKTGGRREYWYGR